jgi:hypothetical protein
VRALPSRGAATCDAGAHSGAPRCPKPFELAHFDQVLLKILKCLGEIWRMRQKFRLTLGDKGVFKGL